jgi:uncharacterized membrane protein YvbJ
MHCPECQFENRDEAKFCGECGHKFEITCPKCGTHNQAGNKFCDECGFSLKPVKEVPDQIVDTRSPPVSTITPEKPTREIAPSAGERKQKSVPKAILDKFT